MRDLFSKQINEKENTVSTWCMLTVSIFIQRNLNHSQTLEHEFDLSTLLLHISVLFVNWMLDLRENEISLFDTKINRKGQKSFHAKKNRKFPPIWFIEQKSYAFVYYDFFWLLQVNVKDAFLNVLFTV